MPRFLRANVGFKAFGLLEMHGIEKEAAIPFTFSNKRNKATFVVNLV
ncbi:MAG: hypothetical protein FJZ67_09435 [Bacteroidetes bacterium]|nr:hypothetical protein [Bacteroidota bacterium]